MATKAYYVSQVSENIGRTPEGYLIARDCVLARTGYQRYSVGDLPQDKAQDLGFDVSKPDQAVDLYRSAKDVFAPGFVSSLESKPVVDDHPPNKEFVNPDNIRDLGMGHVTNVRRGDKPLDSGEWPLVGDVVITRQPLIDEVAKRKKRELSVGYDFEIARDGKRILQIPVVGNHVAVVSKGRAGAEARINDSLPGQRYAPELYLKYNDKGGGDTAAERNRRMAKPRGMSWLDYIFGMGYKAVAVDAEPEDLAEMRKELSATRRATDEDEEAEDRRAGDRRARDKRTGDRTATDRRAGDRTVADKRAADRSTMHAALDRLLDEREAQADQAPPPPPPPAAAAPPPPPPAAKAAPPAAASDVDINELRDLLDQYFSEEGTEEEHVPEAEPVPAGDDEEDKEAEDSEDDEEVVGDAEEEEEVPVAADGKDSNVMESESACDVKKIGDKKVGDKKVGDRKRAADGSQFIDPKNPPLVPKNVLNLLRRSIVKANDSAAINWFNNELSRHNQGGTSGGYRDFAAAAGNRDDARINAAARGMNSGQDYSQLQKQIDARRGKPLSQEVIN